jgi:hypothetical protein
VAIDGPFFLAKLISTMPLMLYLGAGDTKLIGIRLFLGEPPKENPLAGRKPLWMALQLLRDSLDEGKRTLNF